MKNILLLTDFSENSINAIRYVLQLFKEDHCNFFVLYVESSTSYITGDLMLAGNQSIYDALLKTSKTKLEKIIIELIELFRPYLEGIDSVLDIGTGTSIPIHVFADNFPGIKYFISVLGIIF